MYSTEYQGDHGLMKISRQKKQVIDAGGLFFCSENALLQNAAYIKCC
jgi:hypothetical protein